MARVVMEGLSGDDGMTGKRKAYASSFNYDRYTADYLQLYSEILCGS